MPAESTQNPEPFVAEPFVFASDAGQICLAHPHGGAWFTSSWQQTGGGGGGRWIEVGPISDDEARTCYPRKLSEEEAAAYDEPPAPRPATAAPPPP